jgi:putative membrane protein
MLLFVGGAMKRDLINILPAQAGTPLFSSALAGFIATLPMTIFMLLTQRYLPRGQRYDLPPEIIVKDLAQRAHVKQHMNKLQILAATLVSHFSYGATMGLLYPPLSKRLSLPTAIKGAIFGFLIWAASYLGLLPLLGISETAPREPGRRNLMMIAAHLLWGSFLALIADTLVHSEVEP